MPTWQVAFFRFNFYNIMKLHLPTRLRAAVLACFAVVTSFTTTLATGALAGGAFAVAIAGSQAQAAYDEATATITGTASAGAGAIVMSNQTVPDGQTLTFAINQDTAQTYFSGTQTYNGNIDIKNTAEVGADATGMVITDGHGSNIITFNGSITGGGVMCKKGNGEKNTWIFTGDVSQFTGNIRLNSNAINFKIKFDTTNNSTETDGVSGTGDVTFESDYNSLAYEYSGGNTVYVTNAISATGSNTSRVALIGTDAVVFTKDVTIHELRGVIYTGNSANLPTGSANASKITFKGANSTLGKSGKTNAITSTLEVAQGAGLTLAGTMSFASLGDTARVNGDGTVSIASGFTLDLGAEFTPELNREYKLFADSLTVKGWDTLASSAIVRAGLDMGRTQFVTTDTGVLYTAGYSDMATSGTQNWDYTSTVWTTAQDDTEDAIAFAAGDSAVLSTNATLTVQNDGVSANKVTISGSGTEVALSGGALTVANGVIIGNGAKLTLNTKTNATGAIRGKLTVENGGTLQLNANDVTGYNGGATSLHTIRVNAGGSLVLNLSGDANNNETFAGKLYLDGTLSTTGTGIWDVFGSSSEIIVGDNNPSAAISTALRLRRDNAPITVGEGSTLTVSGTLSKGDVGNGILKKQGAGVLKFTSATDSNVNELQLHGGSVQLLGGGSMGVATVNAAGTDILLGGGSSLSSVTSAVDAFTLAGNGTTGTVTTMNANGGMTTLAGTGLSITNLNVAATGGLTVDAAAACSVTNLALAQTMTNKGVLTLGSKLDLSALTLGDSAAVSGVGSAAITAGMLVELGADFTPVLNKEYKVFGDDQTLTGWTELTASSFRKGGAVMGRAVVEMTAKGFKFIQSAYTDMTTAGTQNWNYTDAIWDTTQDSSDAKIAFASGDAAVFSEDTDLTVQSDGVVADSVIVRGEGTDVSLTGGFVQVVNGLEVQSGATLHLNSNYDNGYAGGYIQGAATVKNGGTLKLNAKDVTGWGGNRLSVLTIEEGGTLMLSFGANHETFQGTLYLDGRIVDDETENGVGAWYMHEAKSSIVTGDNKNASISSKLKLGRDDAPITVGSGSTLTVSGALEKEGGNGFIAKNGTGELKITTATHPNTIGYKIGGGTLSFTEDVSVGTIEMRGGNSLITGEAIVNASSLQTLNDGNYNFSVKELNVSGSTNIRQKAYLRDGSLNLNGAVTLQQDIEISDGTLNIDGVVSGSGYSILLQGGSFNLTTDDENNATSIGRVEILEGKGGSVNIGGVGNTVVAMNSYAGSTTITGTGVNMTNFRTRQAATTIIETGAVVTATNLSLGAPIVNKGSLTFSTLNIDSLNGFRMTPGTNATYDDGNAETQNDVNGYLTGASTYEIIQNSGTLKDTSVVLSGAATTGAAYAGGVLTVSATDASTYWVNTTVNAAAALGDGKKYRLNGSSSVLNVTADAENVLKTALGASGTIVLQTNATLTDGATTVFGGNLEIASGAKLSLGAAEVGINVDGTDIVSKTASISSFASTTLNGGTLFVRGVEGNLGTIIAKKGSTGSVLQLYGMTGTGKTTDKRISMETLQLNADLTMPCNFRNNIDIANLSGSGNLVSQHYFRNDRGNREYCYDDVNLNIASLSDYSGAIRLIGGDGNLECAYTMNAATGSKAVTMDSISLTTSTMNLEVTSALKLTGTSGLTLAGQHGQHSTAAIAIRNGGSWAGAVTVTGGTSGNKHSLTSTAGGMNLSRLNVAADAYLDLNGSVSALLMNQAGTVDIAGLQLTDGAVLSYGNAANLLNVTDSMLSGGVVISSGLTLTKDGVNLGLSSAIAQEKIDISNYADSELLVVGDTWHLKSVAIDPSTTVRYYWESDSNTYWVSGKWSLTDNDTTNLVSLPSDMSSVILVYSGVGTEESPNIMRLNNPKSVYGVEVVDGYYRLRTEDNNGKITCTGDLVMGNNGHLIMDLNMVAANLQMAADSSIAINSTLELNGGGDVVVTGAGAVLKLGNGRNLTADALDLSSAGATLSVSGAGNANSANTATLSSINLGEGSGLTLKAGTSNLTVAASSLSLGTGATISLEAGQVLDLKAVTYTNRTGMLNKIAGVVTGAGTVLLQGTNTYTVLSEDGSVIRTNIQVKNGNLTLNSSSTEEAEYTLKVGTDGSLTLDNGATLQMESRAKLSVDGGSLTASTIQLGHTGWTADGLVGHLELKNGNITTGQITCASANVSTLTMSGGTLDITGTVGIQTGIATTITGGTLKASGADGWGVTGAFVGGAAVDATGAGKVTLTNTTITGDITGNNKLVLAGTAHATANATVSGASVGGITVTTTDATKLTLMNTTIGSTITTITNNSALEFSGTQNVTLAGISATNYANVYGDSSTYGANGYKSTTEVYALVSGTAATAVTGTTWQVNGTTVPTSDLSAVSFDGHNLTILTDDSAGKVYYINSDHVEYKAGAGCTAAKKLQLVGGKLVMIKELDTAVTTGGIAVTGSSTTLELKVELDAKKLSLGTDAATVLMGDGTLNLGKDTSLASGITLGTETDAKWTGSVKVVGAALTDANLSGLGITGSTIELDDTDGSLKGGTYAAEVLLSNGSQLTLGANNAFNGGLDATAGTLSIAGKNSISTLTLADGADLGINLAGMGLSSLKDIGTDAILTVGTLNAAGGTVNLKALAGKDLLLTMSDGQSIRLADITTCNATLGLLIGSSTSNVLEVEDANGFTYTYTLDKTDGHTIVTVSAKMNAAGWVGDANDTWKSTDAVGGTDANWASKIGGFYGFGSGTVKLDTNGVTAGDVIVSATKGTTEYTFTGGALNADTLAVNAGSLVLNNTAVATTSTLVSDSAKLTVNTGKKLTVGTDMAVLDTAKLDNKGSIEVTGALSVDKTASVTNSGTLKTGSINASGATIANSGSLTTGGGIIGKLTGEGSLTNRGTLTIESKEATTLGALTNSGTLNVGGDLTVKTAVTSGGTVNATNVTVNGDAAFTSLTTGTLKASSLTVKDAAITTLDTDKLTVNAGTVAVTNNVTLSSLSGSGNLDVAGKVRLTAAVANTVNVKTSKMELATYGSSLGSLCTDTITMLEGSKLSTGSALLKLDSVSALSGDAISIDVSATAFAALNKLSDGRFLAGKYLLIDGADSVDAFTYVNGKQLDAIIATGMNAGLTVTNGVLSLSISEITNEKGEVVGMVWDTSDGNTTTNNGVEIDTDDGFYKALDYVKQVLVTEDVTFDLSADSVGDSVAGNTSDPVAGLLIRNLSGGGELTIKGNAAAQDVATLMNTPGRAISAVELTADAATVNLGLPKGAEGYLESDLSSTGPTLESLSLVNRATVNVNSNTEVLGDTDVADYARLSVKEGNILTTGMLSGTDEAEIGGVIAVRKGGVYTGSYDEATLVADSGSNLRLRTGSRRSLSLVVNGGGQATLDSAGQDGSMDFLRVGESPMARVMSVGSAKLNLLNTAVTDDGIRHSTITLTSDEGNYINKSVVTLSLGAAETARTLSTPGSPVVIDGPVDVTASDIVVNMLGNSVKNGVLEVNTESDKNLTLARFVTGGNVEGNTVTLTGTPEMAALLNKYYTNARLDSKGNIKVDRVTDYYGSHMQLSDNARVGIDMADAALVKFNPQANRSEYAELAGVLDSLDAAVATGNSQAADELGAAVSGASVAALGAAVAGDVERQLMGIRNRTTTMGVDQTQVNENMPYFNAWINAEGDFRRLDQDGTAAGYELSSWGGTVGFDVDMTPRLTMGLAATAMYGDFTAKSADHAEGDLDTYYVTAFARYAANRWSHTFVATAGMADTTLKRTVTHANGSYSTEGDAEAISFGFLYELGYVVAMNESATACLQPVFNVMLSHSSLDGYSEEGRGAALKMGGVDMTTVTFGMGARAQAIVGANLYNRSSMVEGRALLKVRTGDTEAEAENALGAIPGAMGSVKAAEMGSIGAELGVGITVPMGATGGSIFADASLEVGSGYTNINGTVGYRINF